MLNGSQLTDVYDIHSDGTDGGILEDPFTAL